ncbi:MAG TPA: RDD family protein [Longimicrobium sp.]|nr:RDD family protein [Longimicrobium sp.]
MAHAQAQPGFDPRKIITPESFHVAPHLLGLPLASPSRRLAAILLDLCLVAIVANVGGKILFAVSMAAAFFWFAGKRLGNQGGFFSRTARIAFRGVGALMLFVTALWMWQRARRTVDNVVDDDDDRPVAAASAAGGGARKPSSNVGTAMRTAMAVAALESATDSASADRATRQSVTQLRRMAVADNEIRTMMTDAMKDRPAAVRAGVRAALPPPQTLPPARADSANGDEDEENAAKRDTVPTNPDSLAAAYVAAVRGGDSARAEALRPKLASTFARDSLGELRGRVGELEGQNTELKNEKKKLERRGLLATLLEWLDDLGIGFGWTALYFTFFTAMLKGQTPAKKLLGIRVLRLDGAPMSLWASFERYGGYAAGLFTGLMGYAQVYWDRNRQAVQDKISETVVIRDGGVPLHVAPARPGYPPVPPFAPQGPLPPHGQGPQGPQGPAAPPYPPRPPAGIGTP